MQSKVLGWIWFQGTVRSHAAHQGTKQLRTACCSQALQLNQKLVTIHLCSDKTVQSVPISLHQKMCSFTERLHLHICDPPEECSLCSRCRFLRLSRRTCCEIDTWIPWQPESKGVSCWEPAWPRRESRTFKSDCRLWGAENLYLFRI